jgi:hypothetical protein
MILYGHHSVQSWLTRIRALSGWRAPASLMPPPDDRDEG